MMKKLVVGALLLATVGTTGALACGGHHHAARAAGVCPYHGTYHQYVDANHDGVCDHYAVCRTNTWGNGCGHHW